MPETYARQNPELSDESVAYCAPYAVALLFTPTDGRVLLFLLYIAREDLQNIPRCGSLAVLPLISRSEHARAL